MSSDLIFGSIAFAVIFLLEGAFPYFRGRKNRLAHIGPNFSVAAMNGILALIFAPILIAVTELMEEQGWGLLNVVAAPLPVKIAVAFVLFDAWMYAWHRMNHELPFFWLFHRMHHTEREMDSSTALRFHPLEIIFSSFLNVVAVCLIGMDYRWLILHKTVLLPVILFHHSNISWPDSWDRFFKIFIVTPQMHRVHHSERYPLTDSNYSSVLSIWDRLFGTFRVVDDTRSIVFGLTKYKDPRWQTITGLLKTPFVRI